MKACRSCRYAKFLPPIDAPRRASCFPGPAVRCTNDEQPRDLMYAGNYCAFWQAKEEEDQS